MRRAWSLSQVPVPLTLRGCGRAQTHSSLQCSEFPHCMPLWHICACPILSEFWVPILQEFKKSMIIQAICIYCMHWWFIRWFQSLNSFPYQRGTLADQWSPGSCSPGCGKLRAGPYSELWVQHAPLPPSWASQSSHRSWGQSGSWLQQSGHLTGK